MGTLYYDFEVFCKREKQLTKGKYQQEGNVNMTTESVKKNQN